jgi:site-specific recombinase XerC
MALSGLCSRSECISDTFCLGYRKDAGPDEPLPVSAKGDRVIYRSLCEKIKKLGRLSGIEKLHPHLPRHTYGTRLYNVEQELRLVQDQLGHVSPTTHGDLCQDERQST